MKGRSPPAAPQLRPPPHTRRRRCSGLERSGGTARLSSGGGVWWGQSTQKRARTWASRVPAEEGVVSGVGQLHLRRSCWSTPASVRWLAVGSVLSLGESRNDAYTRAKPAAKAQLVMLAFDDKQAFCCAFMLFASAAAVRHGWQGTLVVFEIIVVHVFKYSLCAGRYKQENSKEANVRGPAPPDTRLGRFSGFLATVADESLCRCYMSTFRSRKESGLFLLPWLQNK